MKRSKLISCMAAIFLVGLLIFLYPSINSILSEWKLHRYVNAFSKNVEEKRGNPSQIEETTIYISAKNREYPDLWEDVIVYNSDLYKTGQCKLTDPTAYQTPSFQLANYGLENEVFAVLSIPALKLEMPVYLGAGSKQLNNGAAVLSQTSLPIGGKNTNCVIAAHRGWHGADYFYYLDKLQPGDVVTVTNLWDTLTYKVINISIIEPDDTDAILIQDGKDLITLLTCHPPASGGKKRYVVYCERHI